MNRLLEILENPRPSTVVLSSNLARLENEVMELLADAGSAGVHGSVIGRVARQILGEGYAIFVSEVPLSVALRRIGVPLETDDSGKFYIEGRRPAGGNRW